MIYPAVKMGDSNGESFNGSLSSDSHNYSVLYTVFTDDITDDFSEIKDASGLPQLYEELSNTGTRVINYSYKKRHPFTRADAKTGALWEVNVNYGINSEATLASDGSDPTGFNTRLISFALDFNSYEVTCEQVYTSGTNTLSTTPPRYSNTLSVDPKLRDVEYTTVLRWTQKEDTAFNYGAMSSYIGTINSGAVTVCGTYIPALCGKFRKIQPIYKYNTISQTYYFETSYEIEIKTSTWKQKVYSMGFRQLKSGNLCDIINDDINPSTAVYSKANEGKEQIKEPAYLDLNGAVLKINADPTNYHYQLFQTCPAVNWGGLNLISSLY